MRYVQQDNLPKKEDRTTKEKKAKPVLKAGQKGYDYYDLSSGKKIPTKGGYK